MKAILTIITITIFFLTSCNQNFPGGLTNSEKEEIKKDIQQVIQQISDAAARVDTAKLYEAFDFHNNDFLYIETSGVFYDQSKYKQMVQEFYGPLTSEIIGKGDEKYTYLDKNSVLWSYSGTLTAKFKKGETKVYEPFGMSMLFKKINDKWKVVFLQESTQENASMNSNIN